MTWHLTNAIWKMEGHRYTRRVTVNIHTQHMTHKKWCVTTDLWLMAKSGKFFKDVISIAKSREGIDVFWSLKPIFWVILGQNHKRVTVEGVKPQLKIFHCYWARRWNACFLILTNFVCFWCHFTFLPPKNTIIGFRGGSALKMLSKLDSEGQKTCTSDLGRPTSKF